MGCILPTMHCRSQICWELLYPFAHHCQHARNNTNIVGATMNRSAEPACIFDTLLVGTILANFNFNKKRDSLQLQPEFYLLWPNGGIYSKTTTSLPFPPVLWSSPIEENSGNQYSSLLVKALLSSSSSSSNFIEVSLARSSVYTLIGDIYDTLLTYYI